MNSMDLSEKSEGVLLKARLATQGLRGGPISKGDGPRGNRSKKEVYKKTTGAKSPRRIFP